MYSDETISKVREANDIVDVVGEHVKLEKKGANYFGLCPFHGEKTASFSVNPRKQICYCFGCHKGGNVFDFVMEYEHMNFPEALRHLAERAHIDLPEIRESSEDIRKRQLKDRLLEIHKDAAYFYHDKLQSKEGENGRAYLIDKRKLSPRTVTHFGLGYAGKTPGELYHYLKEKGYTDQELKQSGLITIEEGNIKDKFWNRVMFPIIDINGKVIAFGGRVLGDALPKYLNSPETPIFDKSSVLYGLNFARKSSEKYILLCEGYMDVISLHQAGFTNAVASLGTSFTEKHARLLKRFTETVILTQDSDEAGIKAKIRSFPILHDAGLKVKVLDMGEYKDPDEFIKANGPDAYRRCIASAKNAFLYIVEAIKSGYDLSDPAVAADYLNEIASMLTMFRDDLELDSYIQAVSREQLIDYELLRNSVEKKLAGRVLHLSGLKHTAHSNPELQKTIEVDRRIERAENLILYWLDNRPDWVDKIIPYIEPSDFSSSVRQDLAKKLFESRQPFDPSTYLSGIENEESRSAALEVFTGGGDQNANDTLDDTEVLKLLSDSIRIILSFAIDRKLNDCSLDALAYQTLLKKKSEIKNIKVQ